MVSLDFQICISNCCNSLTVLDLTYSYSPDNLTGWGAPNTNLEDIVSATINVITPDNDSITLDILAEIQAEEAITITPTDLGFTDTILDGVYRFYVSINIGTLEEPVYVTYEKTHLFYCNVNKKIDNLIGTLDINGCCKPCATGNAFDKVLLIWTYFLALKNSACCGKVENFKKLLTILNKLLDSKPCKNC
jgi:hypothetical protein